MILGLIRVNPLYTMSVYITACGIFYSVFIRILILPLGFFIFCSHLTTLCYHQWTTYLSSWRIAVIELHINSSKSSRYHHSFYDGSTNALCRATLCVALYHTRWGAYCECHLHNGGTQILPCKLHFVFPSQKELWIWIKWHWYVCYLYLAKGDKQLQTICNT